MKVLYKSKSGHPVKVVSYCSNKIMQPRTKQTYSYDKVKKSKIFNPISDGVFGTPITDGRQKCPTLHICGNNNPIA